MKLRLGWRCNMHPVGVGTNLIQSTRGLYLSRGKRSGTFTTSWFGWSRKEEQDDEDLPVRELQQEGGDSSTSP